MQESIGERIREARIQRGLTQGQLANGIVAPSMVSQIETGRVQPSEKLLTILADRLGLQVSFLLNGVNEQSQTEIELLLTEYHLLRDAPDACLQQLNRMGQPDSPGLTQNRWMLFKTRALRALHRFDEALSMAERMREVGEGTQNPQLLFLACIECGCVEYGMNNLVGAMQEWSKAVDLGEVYFESDPVDAVDISSDLANLYTILHRVYLQRRDDNAALHALQRANELTLRYNRLRDVADALTANATLALEVAEPLRAKELLTRSVSCLQSARVVEQRIHIQALQQTDGELSDPLALSGVALADAHLHAFLAAELVTIAALVEQGSGPAADSRISLCFGLLDACRTAAPVQYRLLLPKKAQLVWQRAQVRKLSGKGLQVSIGELEEMERELSEADFRMPLLEVSAWLLKLYADAGRTNKVNKTAERILRLMDTHHGEGVRLDF